MPAYVDPATLLLLLATGVAAGTLSALMGIGGGLVMVPALHYGWGIGWHEATALSLLAIVIQAPMGIWRHRRKGAVDLRMAVPLTLGGLAGVLIGDALRPHVPVDLLRLLFSAVLAFAAYRMVRPGTPSSSDGGSRMRSWAIGAVGALAGILAAWLGIGGGMVTVPALVMAGTSAHLAVGTSLVPVWTNAAVATGLHAADGILSLDGVALGVGAMAGAVLGVRIAHRLPEARLRRVLAAVLLGSGAWMAATTLWPTGA